MLGALLWFAFGALAVLGGLGVRRRLDAHRRGGAPPVDDDAVRKILGTGRLTTGGPDEEPLDLDTIQEEEERFWSERWDEPDPW